MPHFSLDNGGKLREKLDRFLILQQDTDIRLGIETLWEPLEEYLNSILDLELVVFFSIEEETAEFVIKKISQLSMRAKVLEEFDYLIESGIFAWVMKRMQPSLVPTSRFKGKSVLIIPFVTIRSTYGFSMIVSSLPADEITFETLTLLSLISRQVGLIMENIKAYTSLADEHQALLDAQERIILSEKMASIGRLASRASHEILNPLNIIMGNAQLLLAKANLDATKKKYVERILSQAERIEGIVRALIKVSDLSSTHKKPLDLTKLVEKSIKLFRTDFSKADIRVYFNSDSREITVLGHELGLLEVMVSIFRNSVEAMPNGGKIEISLSSNPGLGTATLTVSDNGVGIQEDDLDKLFEPFFTTKNTKNNLGIGLYLAYTIIKEHGGNIEITGEEGKGAATTITLPLYNETRTEPA